ncbi:hypothetical protein V8C86DRAFT_274673 [Haematococcus lacustris]
MQLHPYAEAHLVQRWQQGLVQPGYLFRRAKLQLFDILLLRAKCQVALGLKEGCVERVQQAAEAIYLAVAALHSTMAMPREVMEQLQELGQQVAAASVRVLQNMQPANMTALLARHDVHLKHATPHMLALNVAQQLALPVRFSVFRRQLEAASLPLMAYVKAQDETRPHYMQRYCAQLLALVPHPLLAALQVPCTSRQPGSPSCSSYLPAWCSEPWDEVPPSSTPLHTQLPPAYASLVVEGLLEVLITVGSVADLPPLLQLLDTMGLLPNSTPATLTAVLALVRVRSPELGLQGRLAVAKLQAAAQLQATQQERSPVRPHTANARHGTQAGLGLWTALSWLQAGKVNHHLPALSGFARARLLWAQVLQKGKAAGVGQGQGQGLGRGGARGGSDAGAAGAPAPASAPVCWGEGQGAPRNCEALGPGLLTHHGNYSLHFQVRGGEGGWG